MKYSKFAVLLAVIPLLFSFTNSSSRSPQVYKLSESTVALNQNLFISTVEVSNREYKKFLMGLIENGEAGLVPEYSPDFESWSELDFNNPYAKYYFSHPAFENYPVVGVSYEAVQAFCAWKTRTFEKSVTEKKAKNAGENQYRFRLPTEAEWKLAALGEQENEAIIAGGFLYARSHKGRYQLNHKLGKGDYAGSISGHSNDFEGYMITAPVRSFFSPNTGIYNMGGNVAEMMAEEGISKGGSWYHEVSDCTVEAVLEYEKPHSWLGFRYVVEAIN